KITWAKSTGTDEARSSPVVIDLDGDGVFEIAAGTTSGCFVEVFSSRGDEGFVWTFPKWPGYYVAGPFAWPGSPAVGELDSKVSGVEVVIGNRIDGKLYAFDGDNTDQTNDGITLTSLSWYPYDIGTDGKDWDVLWVFTPPEGIGENGIVSTPVISDLDGDGKTEVVVASTNKCLYILDGASGQMLHRFCTGGPLYASPAVADVDGDKIKEIVIGGTDGRVYLFKWTRKSKSMKSYSFDGRAPFYSSPAIGDVDGDGMLDIIVPSTDGNIYILNSQMECKRKVSIGSPVFSSPALARRGGKGLAIYVGADDGYLYLFDGVTGEQLDRFKTAGEIHTSPSVADIDGDGKLEIVFYDWGDIYWCIKDNNSSCEPYAREWPMFRANPFRTGEYERVGYVKGKVIDSQTKKGIAGAQVTAQGNTRTSTLTDEIGRYVLCVSPGQYTLLASADGYQPQSKEITIRVNQTLEIDFELRPLCIVRGTVRDSRTNTAIPGVWVGAVGTAGGNLVAEVTRTNNDGQFRLDLRPGSYTFHFLAWGYKPATAGYTFAKPLDINIDLEPGDTLVGKAVLFALSVAGPVGDPGGAPYLWAAKGRHFDPQHGHSKGDARWATPEEIRTTGYFWGHGVNNELLPSVLPGLDCTGLVMWAYSVAYNPNSTYFALNNGQEWYGSFNKNIMEMVKDFTVPRQQGAYEQCLSWFKNQGYLIMEPGYIMYFVDEAGYEIEHAVIYIGGGYIVHASGYHKRVVYERLADALQRYKNQNLRHNKITIARFKSFTLSQGPFVTVSVKKLDFYNVPVNRTEQRQIVITNMGSTCLTVNLSTTSPFSVEADTVELAPTESRSVNILFTPAEPRSYTVELRINAQIGEKNVQEKVTLQGAGRASGEPALQVDINALSFGMLAFGNVKQKTTKRLKFINRGEGDLKDLKVLISSPSFNAVLTPEKDGVEVTFTPPACRTARSPCREGPATMTIESNGGNVTILVFGYSSFSPSTTALHVSSEHADLVLAVSPNPVRQIGSAIFKVTACNKDPEAMMIEIYDLSGRLVWIGERAGTEVVWDTCDSSGFPLANGVYLYVAYVKVDGEWIRLEPQKLVILR
ncbi:MAG: carboxypeptidase regulatory-like domain-containing protein, partial [Candidatus Hadarchaeum sp.]